jgi:hypothetical protein
MRVKRLSIAVIVLLSSCAAPPMVGGAPVYYVGAVRDMPRSDIEAAITAMRADLPEVRSEQLREIEVVDTNTMHLAYREAGSSTNTRYVVKRVRGRWHYTWEIVIGGL